MELEEAIKIYNELKKYKEIIGSIDTDFFFNFIEIVLNALENAIPKKKIEDKIEQCQNYFRTTYVPNYDGLIFESQKEKYISVINERERKIAQIKILQELLEDK